jgi:uncharacterized membrane protein YgcG
MHRRAVSPAGVVAAGVMAVVLAVGALWATPASADGPITFDGGDQLQDPAGLLGDRADEVRDALDRLLDEDGVQLYVVVVEELDGTGAQDWADRTAAINGLGVDDALLVVASEDRQYAWSVDQDFPLSDEQLRDAARESIEPQLRDEDWAGAAIGAADAYRARLGGTEGSGSTDGGSTGGGVGLDSVLFVGLILALLAVGGFLWWRSRSSRVASSADSPPVDPLDAMSLDELTTRANAELVELDDALRTSRFDLDMAIREFGAEATAPFTQALDRASASVADGWASMAAAQEAADETARRATLRQVLSACADADAALDEQSGRFEALRDRAGRVEQVVAQQRSELERVSALLPGADAAMAEMVATYAPGALTTVDDDPAQARERLTFAVEALAQGEAALAAGDRNAAALATSASEEAIASAEVLVQTVERTRGELATAAAGLDGALGEVRTDLAEAAALTNGTVATSTTGGPTGDAGAALAAPVAAAQAAVERLERTRAAGPIDPVAELAALGAAGAALDEALAAFRERQAARERAAALLQQTLGAVRSRIAGVQDYVTTRRGAVGPEARTALAEAERLLALADASAATDPEAALGSAQQAQAAADRAANAARSDVDDYGQRPWGGGGRGGGGNLGTMVLGGILLDSVLRGSRGWRLRRRVRWWVRRRPQWWWRGVRGRWPGSGLVRRLGRSSGRRRPVLSAPRRSMPPADPGGNPVGWPVLLPTGNLTRQWPAPAPDPRPTSDDRARHPPALRGTHARGRDRRNRPYTDRPYGQGVVEGHASRRPVRPHHRVRAGQGAGARPHRDRGRPVGLRSARW